jgi:hypothetical protein
MIRLYCRAHRHGKEGLCPSCLEVDRYARTRLEKCPYGEAKPTCLNCPIHCYSPSMKERVREVMRWSGPRMIFRHPVLAIFHMLDGRRRARELRRRKAAPPAPAVKDAGSDPRAQTSA